MTAYRDKINELGLGGRIFSGQGFKFWLKLFARAGILLQSNELNQYFSLIIKGLKEIRTDTQKLTTVSWFDMRATFKSRSLTVVSIDAVDDITIPQSAIVIKRKKLDIVFRQ